MSPAVDMGPAPDRSASGVRIALSIGEPGLRQQIRKALEEVPADVLGDPLPAGTIEALIAGVERLRPDVVLLGLPGLPFDPVALVARLTRLDSVPAVVVVNDSADPETILRVMRAGAVEFVYPPLEGRFIEAMGRVIGDRASLVPERRAGKALAFVSAKGGCGATTLACHVARHLRQANPAGNADVLLADLDFHSGIAAMLLQTSPRYTLDDVLASMHRMDAKLWKALVTGSAAGVDVVGPGPEPVVQVPAQATFQPVLQFWRSQYAYAVLDLGHGRTPHLADVLDSLETLVLVAVPELPALRQARQLIHHLARRNFGGDRLKLVINRMPRRSAIGLSELEKAMGHPVMCGIPDETAALAEAWSEPRLVAPDSDFGRRMATLADRLAGIEPVETKSRGLFSFRGKG